MAIGWLEGGQSGGFPPGGSGVDTWEFGTAGAPITDGYLYGLRWYRGDTVSANKPQILRIWDTTATGAPIYQAPTVPDNGAVGWQTHLLTTNVPLVAGREYRVTIPRPSGVLFPVAASTTRGTPDTPWLYADLFRCYGPQGSYAYPVNHDTANLIGADMGWTDVPPDPGGTGNPVLTGDLQDWLDTVTGQQPHSAPLLDHATLTTVRNVVGSTSGQLDATKAVSDAIHDLLTATNKNLGTLWDLAGHLADLEIAAWQHFFGSGEQRLTGPNSAGGSAFYTADGQLVSQLIAEIWQRVRVLRNDVPFGVGDWTMSAEDDFTDAIAFAAPADAYVLSITSYQPTQPATESPAGLWLPRLGWWCVLTGSLASERHFVDFQQEMLSDHGRRMAGCAIQLKPGTIAHVQAWLLA